MTEKKMVGLSADLSAMLLGRTMVELDFVSAETSVVVMAVVVVRGEGT